MLDKVRLALRITTSEFDTELTDLIAAAYLDLGIAGVTPVTESDPLVIRAVCTYCKMNFGEPDQYERLKASYDEQKAQLSMHSSHTDYSMLEED